MVAVTATAWTHEADRMCLSVFDAADGHPIVQQSIVSVYLWVIECQFSEKCLVSIIVQCSCPPEPIIPKVDKPFVHPLTARQAMVPPNISSF